MRLTLSQAVLLQNCKGSRAILLARPLYINLGSGQEVRLLAGFTVACVGEVWVLYVHGIRLRVGSRFAVRQGN